MVDDSANLRDLKLYAVEHADSGITAAYYLALMGHEPEIFEQRKHLGGMY